jgi:esterase/lipase/1-acyl-sn-glycerol-3-phosphate acyltransferase
MPLSKLILQAAKLTIDTAFKASEADIRVHDIENVPEKNVLYVVNHFTRIETAFLPYVLNKYTGQLVLSLASSTFFSGKFGSLLRSLGAVSTKDPDRDKILTNALLTGKMSVVIFPEGQMIKDKKLIEKGKLLVYNTGIRRPPHTGAAKIALRVEMFRKVIKQILENGDKEELNKIKQNYGINNEDLKGITEGSTSIVPVNITYYPIRARNNIIKKTVERFTGPTDGRIAEELEIEGTMLAEGVDIDINFGTPIKISDYLKEKKFIQNVLENRDGQEAGEYINSIDIKKESISIMQKYMRSIYRMTTVNHDHIFAYILKKHPHTAISDYDFKNRASLAIERIKELKLSNFHTTLLKKDENIGADIFHEKYDSFIEEAVANGIVMIDGNKIIKNQSKFSSTYNFHKIRKDNFVEVLNNEIEPLKELTSMLRWIMIKPPFLIRRQIKNTFSRLDLNIFKEDYITHFIEGESKPENIGSPFFMTSIFNRYGVLLIHGYMSAPEEVKLLAEKIFKAGYDVYGVRLRGHGTSPEDLSSRRWEDWYESVNRGYVSIKNSSKEFAVAGFSTGAGLALLQAARKPGKFKAVIPVSAPLRLQDIRTHLTGAVVFFNNILDKFKMNKKKMEFVANNPENPHINYTRNPVKGTYELDQLMNVVERELKNVKIPALIIQGSHDPVVNPQSADEIFEKIGSEKKTLIKVNSVRHGIVRGDELTEVAGHIISFLNKIFK